MTVLEALRGAVAGASGGIVGGAVKLACEAIVPPRPPGREPPPGVLVANVVRRIDGRELSSDEKRRAAMTTHWMFSVLTGACYGIVVDALPMLAKTEGIPLGLSLWIALHEIALPLLRATPPLGDLPVSEHVNESITHAAFGFAVERTRRSIRPLLAPM